VLALYNRLSEVLRDEGNTVIRAGAVFCLVTNWVMNQDNIEDGMRAVELSIRATIEASKQ
jgi:hypothetical protein